MCAAGVSLVDLGQLDEAAYARKTPLSLENKVMTVATVMVYVDPPQQAEEQVRVARSIATRFDASIIGVSAVAVEPTFVAEGVIIEETTPEDLKRMKTALA
jgi:hypothetical protein